VKSQIIRKKEEPQKEVLLKERNFTIGIVPKYSEPIFLAGMGFREKRTTQEEGGGVEQAERIGGLRNIIWRGRVCMEWPRTSTAALSTQSTKKEISVN